MRVVFGCIHKLPVPGPARVAGRLVPHARSGRIAPVYRVRWLLVLGALPLIGGAALGGAGPNVGGRLPAAIVIDVGTEEATAHLGYGWSRLERDGERTFSWIKRLEADVWFELERGRALELSVTAAPLYLSQRRQNIGVYVNDHFLVEWLCPHAPRYETFRARIPAEVLREGKNRLVLRMGYKRSIGPDRRELSLAVDRMRLEPAGER